MFAIRISRSLTLFSAELKAFTLFVLALICHGTGIACAENEVKTTTLDLVLLENADAGTVVDTLSERYPNLCNFRFAERSRTLSFSLDKNSGKIVVREGATLNFERRSTLTLTIVADTTPSEEELFQKQFASSLLEQGVSTKKLDQLLPTLNRIVVRIDLQDVSEAPRLSDLEFELEREPSHFAGAFVGTVAAEDEDEGDVLSYSIVAGNENGWFSIQKTSGTLTVSRNVSSDFELQSIHALQIQAVDESGQTAECSVSVRVICLDNQPAVNVQSTNVGGHDELAPSDNSSAGNSSTNNSGPSSVAVNLRTDQGDNNPAQSENSAARTSAEPSRVPNTNGAAPAAGSDRLLSPSEAVPSAIPAATSTPATAAVAVPGTAAENPPLVGDEGTSATGEFPPAAALPLEPSKNVSPPSLGLAGEHQSEVETAESETELSESDSAADAGLLSDEMNNAEDLSVRNQDSFARFVVAVLAALGVIAAAVFFVSRRVSAVRKAALHRKENEETAATLAAENDKESESLVATERFIPAPEEIPPEKQRKQKPPIEDIAVEAEPFDPESLISDEYFADSVLDQGESSSATQGSELVPVFDTADIQHPSVLTAKPTSEVESHPKPEIVQALLSQINERDDVIMDLRSKLEALGDRLESLAAGDSDRSEIRDSLERRGHLRNVDGADGWNDDPLRYERAERDSAFDDHDGYVDPRDDEQQSSDRDLSDTNPFGDQAGRGSDIEETPVDERTRNLRNELADLFALHNKQSDVMVKPAEFSIASDLSAISSAEQRSPEETHLDSVAQYLTQLLDRSKKENVEEAIFTDRRKSDGKGSGKWDGIDRRGEAKKSKPEVKSYIETYLSEHGGQLAVENDDPVASSFAPESTAPEAVVRRPVDVQALRQHMNSFRAVATMSVAHALASHKIRQAKGKLALRSMLVIGLAIVATLAIATNAAKSMHFASLNWMMGALICLTIAELCLRVKHFRRDRNKLTPRIDDARKSVLELPGSAPDESGSQAASGRNA